MTQPSSSRSLSASREWLARSAKRIPGCAQTFSKSPGSFVRGVTPNFAARAKGPSVWDVDGNRYIDYVMGLGPVILGHADEAVNAAAMRQMELGVTYSLPHTIEVELAEALCERIPCAEMVRFGKNGSDVTSAAVRVARAYTRRDKVLRCGYHGWQDWYIGSTSRWLGVPNAVRDLTFTFPYNDPASLDALFRAHHDQVACVVIEPVTFDLPAAGYLEAVREVCRRNGALLVFDEIVTGFRVHAGGAQALFGVTPDLACFGKALANGFPLSVIAGRADVMKLFEEVFFSFTFAGEAVSIAASLATIGELERRNGIAEMGRMGARLQTEARRLLAASHLRGVIDCVGLPQWTTLRCSLPNPDEVLQLRSLYQQETVKRGILSQGSHMLSVAHDDTIIDETLSVYREVFEVLAEAVEAGEISRFLEGPAIVPVLRT